MKETRVPGKTALVTGAGRGIGAATALALARRGVSCALLVRNPEAARETAEAVEALGVACLLQPCDVSDNASVRAAVARALQAWDRVDIVVNNAGRIDPIGQIADTDPQEWAQAVAVNLLGAYHVVHAALPALLAGGEGAIVNVSTGAAYGPREGWSAYCSSKAALAMLTRCIAHEYGPRGLAVYGLQPGLVDTAMQSRIRESGMNEISRIPQEQLAPPAYSAEVIAWLADERPEDLLGQDLSVRDPQLASRAARPPE